MKIVLRIGTEDKTFINDFVKARVFRNALKLNAKIKTEGGDFSAELFDTMIEFVVTAFDGQFTVDDFWDGVEAHKLQDEVMRIFKGILNFGGLEPTGDEGNETGK